MPLFNEARLSAAVRERSPRSSSELNFLAEERRLDWKAVEIELISPYVALREEAHAMVGLSESHRELNLSNVICARLYCSPVECFV